jgi:hypothetical protein
MGSRQPDLEAGVQIASSHYSPIPSMGIASETKLEPITDTSSLDSPDSSDDDDSYVDDDFGSDTEDGGGWGSSQGTNLAIRQCDCFPDNETKENCKARIARIVEKQRQCYRMSKIYVIHNRGQKQGGSGMARPRTPFPIELWPNYRRRDEICKSSYHDRRRYI